MTRINVGIPPRQLSKKHLLAEHREIKRIPNAVKKGRFSMKGQPTQFTLGKGHVKFFYDKLLFLHKRYLALYKDCLRRKCKVTDFSSAFEGVPPELFNDYTPKERDKILIRERITLRNKEAIR